MRIYIHTIRYDFVTEGGIMTMPRCMPNYVMDMYIECLFRCMSMMMEIEITNYYIWSIIIR